VRAGTQSFAYLDVSTIANTFAYFDLTDCSVGTIGSNAKSATTENYGGGLCRIILHYTGTSAAHTHRVLCAEADGDKSSDVGTACLGVDYFQIELADYATSLHEVTTARNDPSYGGPSTGLYPGDVGEARVTFVRPYRSIGGTSTVIMSVNDGSLGNVNRITHNATRNNNFLAGDVGGVNQYLVEAIAESEDASDSATVGVVEYLAASWSGDYASVWTDFLYGVDDTPGTPLNAATASRINVGMRGNSPTQPARAVILNVDFYATQSARVVTIWGDSLTRATPYVDDGEQAYKILSASVKGEHKTYAAFGVGGETCDEVAARFSCTGPVDTAIIWCGTGDIAALDDAAEVQADIEGIVAAADACGVGVILVTITPRGLAAGPEAERQDINTWIRSQASTAPVYAVVDADALLGDGVDLDPLYDSGDNLHLNAAGQQVVADAYAAAVVW
jgi:lysophospholipase L1-like esterase